MPAKSAIREANASRPTAGRPLASKVFREPAIKGATRPVLRRPDTDTGAVADLIAGIEHVDDGHAQIDVACNGRGDALDGTQVDRALRSVGAAVRGGAGFSRAGPVKQVGVGAQGIGDRIGNAGGRRVRLVVIGMDPMPA